MSDIHVSRHASKRIRKRCNLPKSAVDANADRAYEYGVRHAETVGSLNRYITKLYYSNINHANHIRIYNQYVYIFKDQDLITVIALPKKYYDVANKLQQKKKDKI